MPTDSCSRMTQPHFGVEAGWPTIGVSAMRKPSQNGVAVEIMRPCSSKTSISA